MKDAAPFPLKRIREMIAYDPSLGIMFWRKSPSPKVKAGARADFKVRLGYRAIRIDGISIAAHRVAWILHYRRKPKGIIDHWNGVTHDNRIVNLREATARQNAWNSKKEMRANFVRPGVWTASYVKGGKKINLGKFNCPVAAVEAKAASMRSELGEFCFFNRANAPMPLHPRALDPPPGTEIFGSGI